MSYLIWLESDFVHRKSSVEWQKKIDVWWDDISFNFNVLELSWFGVSLTVNFQFPSSVRQHSIQSHWEQATSQWNERHHRHHQQLMSSWNDDSGSILQLRKNEKQNGIAYVNLILFLPTFPFWVLAQDAECCWANDIWNSKFKFLLDLKYISRSIWKSSYPLHIFFALFCWCFFGAAAALQWGEEFQLKEFVRQLKFFSKFIPVVTLLMWLIEKWVGARRGESTHVRAMLWTRCLGEYVRCRWRTKEFDLDSAKLAVFNCHDESLKTLNFTLFGREFIVFFPTAISRCSVCNDAITMTMWMLCWCSLYVRCVENLMTLKMTTVWLWHNSDEGRSSRSSNEYNLN